MSQRFYRVFLLYGLICCMLLPAVAFADQPVMPLTRNVVEIFPGGPIGGGLTRYGKAKVSTTTTDDGKLIAYGQPKGHGNWLVRWFPNHKPIALGELAVTNNLQLAIDIQSKQSVTTSLITDWRVDGRKVGSKVSHSQPVKLAAGSWTTVTLPIPPVDPTVKLQGLYLQTDQPGHYSIRKITVVSPSMIAVEPLTRDALFDQDHVQLAGQAAPGMDAVQLTVCMDQQEGKDVAINQPVKVTNGRFTYTLKAAQLKPGHLYHVQWRSDVHSTAPIDQPIFAFLQLHDRKLPAASVKDGKLVVEGKPLAFVGINYTKFLLGFSNRSDFEKITRQLTELKTWGIRVTRVPINLGLIQVAPGVFPDNPQWAQIIREHHLDPRFFELLEYHIKLAANLGIYTIIDWHGFATNPYRYFLGGMPSDREKGKPGKAIAWLAPDDKTRVPFDYANPKHRKALLDCHAWIAKHFKGNPNILGIEVPFNEPHDVFSAVEDNLHRMIDDCAKVIKRQDPDRLTFAMSSSYSHDNATPTGTWRLPDRADGAGSHFYMSNGPIPLRPEAPKYKHPWLVRNVAKTFKLSTTAVLLPFSTQGYPQYNGEDGDHGFADLLPETEPTLAARQMIENGMVQNWFAGQAGYVLWTMHDAKHFGIFHDQYAALFKKFSPLYAAGPVDWSQSEVLFIQNPAAGKIANGHNYSCVPIAKMMIDLHLDPVHYMTDDQFISVGVACYAKGLEQVQGGARDLSYKAIVLDTRNCDKRVIKTVQSMKVPVLITDDMSKVTDEQLARFLTDAGVPVDQQTPTSLHWGVGPRNVVLYNHTDTQVNAKAYPRVARESQFKLVTDDGKPLFVGTSAQLQTQGVQVSIEPRTALILGIQ